jgi:hypothetical protein
MTDSQSSSLSWYQAPIWHQRPIFSILPLIIFRQLRVCWCRAPSLTRSRVCTFQLLPGIASAAFLRSESHGTHKHILLSLFLGFPQPGGPGSCIYFPQDQLRIVLFNVSTYDATKNTVKKGHYISVEGPLKTGGGAVKEELSMWQDVGAHKFVDVEAPKFFRKSSHRWRWDCEPSAPTGRFILSEDSCYSSLLDAE